jgi:hypothetical protein
MTIANITSRSWTYTLTADSLLIDNEFSFVVVSVLCTSGTVTILGGTPSGGIQPTPITLAEGQSVTIDSGSASIISDITIDATSGVAAIIGR